MKRIGPCDNCGADMYRGDDGRIFPRNPAPGCLCSVDPFKPCREAQEKFKEVLSGLSDIPVLIRQALTLFDGHPDDDEAWQKRKDMQNLATLVDHLYKTNKDRLESLCPDVD